MFKAIIFLPLIGSIIAGLFGRYIGARPSEVVTSSFLVAAAILSCIGFYDVAILGQAQTVHVLSWISSGSLDTDLSDITDLLAPYPGEKLNAYPISTAIG